MDALPGLAAEAATTAINFSQIDSADEDSYPRSSFDRWKITTLTDIEADIARYLDALPQQSPLTPPLRHAMRGGKRFRALLARAACEALGGNIRRVSGAALALELIQAQSLILDDLPCMDDADERRGHPCLHRTFGEPLALLAAATLLSDAYAALGRDGSELLANKLECLATACGSHGIAHGQAAELCAQPEGPAKKTAPLLVAAAHLGAMAAGDADSFRVTALCAFANEVGLAYQLRDDILDGDRDHDMAARAAQRAIERALVKLTHAGLDTPVLRALAREALQRER